MRTNSRTIETTLKRINKRFDLSMTFNHIGGSGYRVTTANEARDISPRLRGNAMLQWLEAFECGADELNLQLAIRGKR